MKLVCPCVSYNYYSCGLKFNWIATPPVCQHHDNEILQATFTTGSLNVHLKTLKWIPCDGLAVVQLQDFKRLFFSVYLWAISECCKIYRTVRQPQTALIDNTIPRNYMVMVTSAAKHSIRHDLHQGHMWSGGAPTKQLSQLVSPAALPPYIIVLLKYKRSGGIQRPRTPMSMDRWLILAPAVA